MPATLDLSAPLLPRCRHGAALLAAAVSTSARQQLARPAKDAEFSGINVSERHESASRRRARGAGLGADIPPSSWTLARQLLSVTDVTLRSGLVDFSLRALGLR